MVAERTVSVYCGLHMQKSRKSRCGGELGMLFWIFARSSDWFSKISGKVGAKMRRVAPKIGQEGSRMAVLASTWEVLARSWLQLDWFWKVLGRSLEHFGRCVVYQKDFLNFPHKDWHELSKMQGWTNRMHSLLKICKVQKIKPIIDNIRDVSKRQFFGKQLAEIILPSSHLVTIMSNMARNISIICGQPSAN